MRGNVTWFHNGKGYGFITPVGGGRDVYVHHTSIVMEGYRFLQQGELVEFDIVKDGYNNKPMAVSVKRLGATDGSH